MNVLNPAYHFGERWGDGEMGRWGDWEKRRQGDGGMGKQGDGEKYLFLTLNSQLLTPNY
ncbi:MAG: hypothetical protein AAF349_23170 [Cyanobacteria bacterium P01_A01_bin.68]